MQSFPIDIVEFFKILFWNKTICTLINHGKFLFKLAFVFCFGFSSGIAWGGELDKTGTLWAPYSEWTFKNPTYSGNPFDLIASATFTHSVSGETRTTEMFYAGNDTWKLRFTGTRTGIWNFITKSFDPDINGHSGTVTIRSNPNPKMTGFLTSNGNRFARQVGENAQLQLFIFNVYQSDAYDVGPLSWYNNSDVFEELDKGIEEVQKYGCTVLYSSVIGNRWFKLETQRWDEHENENPDLRTFEALELAISYIHSKGLHLHIWAWGDESRRQTPIGVGNINGVPDRRLQRYIAARLGPLPGWTMGYGFDLQEWVSENQIGEWAAYLHQHMGWQHLLWGRGRSHSELNALSYSGFGNYDYDDAKSRLDSDVNRPHLYSERFIFLRRDYWDMNGTRRKMWQYTMAGGMGSWWGRDWTNGKDYPNPEQLRTHKHFWDGRFLLDMVSANQLSDGYCLKSPSNTRYVFYRENTSSIQIDLSKMAGAQQAIAVDTKLAYAEIDLNMLSPANQTWTAPYSSDWAIAVGDFSCL